MNVCACWMSLRCFNLLLALSSLSLRFARCSAAWTCSKWASSDGGNCRFGAKWSRPKELIENGTRTKLSLKHNRKTWSYFARAKKWSSRSVKSGNKLLALFISDAQSSVSFSALCMYKVTFYWINFQLSSSQIRRKFNGSNNVGEWCVRWWCQLFDST